MNEKIVIRAEKILGKNLMARAQAAQPELEKLFKQRMRCYKTFDAKVTEAISAQCADAKLIFEAIGRYRQKRAFPIHKDHLLALQLDVMVPNSLQNTLKTSNSDQLITFIVPAIRASVGAKNVLKIDFENNGKNTYLRVIVFPLKKEIHQGKALSTDLSFHVYLRERVQIFNEKLTTIARCLNWIEDEDVLEAVCLFDHEELEDD